MNPPSGATPNPGLARVRVLTLNLGLLGLDIGPWRIAVDRHLDARLAAAPGLLASINADILALQEIYSHADIAFLTKALGARYPYRALPPQTGTLVGSGLMLLSRFPIVRNVFLPSSRSRWRTLRRQHGVLATDVDLAGLGCMRFFNAHISASLPFSSSASAASSANRRGEIAHLLEAARSARSDAILVGDFNASPAVHAGDYAELVRAGFVDSFRAVKPDADARGEATWNSTNPLNMHGRYRDAPSQRIDHLFVPQSSALCPVSAEIVLREAVVRGRNGEMVPLSDHYGLLVTLGAR